MVEYLGPDGRPAALEVGRKHLKNRTAKPTGGETDGLAPTLDPQRILKDLDVVCRCGNHRCLHPRSIRRGY